MKIDNLIRKPTLNDLFDVPGELNWSKLDISESLNYKASDIKWTMVGKNMNGTFKVDSSTYVIELEPGVFQKYNFINAAFYKVGIDGNKHYELTLDTKNPSKVLGGIINGIFGKIKEFHYDALVFAASNNIEKRMSFYNGVANKFKKNFAITVSDVKTEKGKCTILIAKTVAKTDIDEFIKYVKESIKNK